MPYTLNGIGTHYYGRSNASARRGNCASCGKLANLTSYDTRECFCIIFIPIIPLTKYRIIDDCSSCRRHRRMKLEDFNAQLRGDVEPLRAAVAANPRNPEAREALVQQLIAFGLLADAESAARESVNAIPENAALNRQAGQILSMKGNLPDAAAFLERAVHFDGNDGAARLSLARVYYFQSRFDDAIRQLEEARRLNANDAGVNSMLAECYFQARRWQDALAAYYRIAGPNPHKSLLRRIANIKKQIGYELTPAERKAARRWWPFGGGDKPAKITPATVRGSGDVRPRYILFGVVGFFVLAIVGTFAYGYYNAHYVDVYFDSVHPKTTFRVDGKDITTDTPPVKKTLKPGVHQIVVLDGKGKEIEKRSITIAETSPIDFTTRAFVYNTQALRVYRRSNIVYSSSNDGESSSEFIAGDPFFEVQGVDYLFTAPPQTVELSSGSTRTTKVAFEIEPASLAAYGHMRIRENKFDDAAKAFSAEVAAEPCDLDARRELAYVLAFKSAGDASKVAREGIEQCKAKEVAAHRLHQDIERRIGKTKEVLDEYRAALDAHPQSAPFHYLYGRLQEDHNAEKNEQRAALQLDPHFGWAHAALAYTMLQDGEYSDSMNEYAEAMKSSDHDDTAVLYYAYAAIASGRAAEAHAVVDPLDTKSYARWNAKWRLAVAEKNWRVATQMYKDAAKNDENDPAVWNFGVELFRANGDTEAYEKHLSRARARTDLKIWASVAEVEDAIDKGAWSDATRLAEPLRMSAYLSSLYGAAAMIIGGDAKGGVARAQAIASWLPDDKDIGDDARAQFAALASAMTTGSDREVLKATSDDLLMIKHAYFFLGAGAMARGDRARAKEMFRRSATASFDQGFPMPAAQKLAS